MPERQRPLRVFLGPMEVSGYYSNLEAGMLGLGVSARFVSTHPHPFDYEHARENPWPARLASSAVLVHRRASGIVRLAAAGLYLAWSVVLLLWSLPRFDAYVFAWGTSILPRSADLAVLRLFRKTVVSVVGHGSEARPPYMSTPTTSAQPLPVAELERLRAETGTIAARIRRISRLSTHTVGLPTTGQFFTAPFVNFYALGLPTPEVAAQPRAASGEIVVVHVPSNPEVKGTAAIRECMAVVVERHPAVRYVELSGRPHAEILDALAGATLVVDQLWSDIPMAVVGTEAAALGTATVISGYAWDYWETVLEPDALPPAVRATPATLLDAVEGCVRDLEATRALGQRAQHFVRGAWSREAVAARYLRLIAGDVPAEWIVRPADVTYAWGVGVSKERINAIVAQFVEMFGASALHWAGAAEAYGLDRPRGGSGS